MPNSRGRKSKKAGSGSRRSGDPRLASVDALAAARYENAKKLLVNMLAGGVPGESLVPLMLMTLWVLRAAESGAPPNVCVDACQTLRYAFAQFGVEAQLVAVDLVVDDPARGTTVHGTPEPSWEGTVLDGHCILWLPRWRRFLDPTVTQYADAARLGFGPVMGRMDAVTGSEDEVKGNCGRGCAAGGRPLRRPARRWDAPVHGGQPGSHTGHHAQPVDGADRRRAPPYGCEPGLLCARCAPAPVRNQHCQRCALPPGDRPARRDRGRPQRDRRGRQLVFHDA